MTRSTSYEFYKGSEQLNYLRHTRDFDFPFSEGLAANLQDFFCARDGAWARALGRPWRPPSGAPRENLIEILKTFWRTCGKTSTGAVVEAAQYDTNPATGIIYFLLSTVTITSYLLIITYHKSSSSSRNSRGGLVTP
ncbi:unnamed protein product [Heterosigma akashiwo]